MSKDSLSAQIAWIEAGQPPPLDAGIFGLTVNPVEADLVLLPVPWDATASYHRGAGAASPAILRASHQLDLYDRDFGEPYKCGIAMLSHLPRLPYVQPVGKLETNLGSDSINRAVYEHAKTFLMQGKLVGVVGGDHASPYGLIKALAEQASFGVLQIDAHHDLREAYEGFTHSHASIMYNVLHTLPQVTQLVAVGIRDYSSQEYELARSHEKVRTFYDADIKRDVLSGAKTFKDICVEIVGALPERVYISCDIDGLDPTLCPGTGTPVPGGLSFAEFELLLVMLVQSGRKVIGFDLCEVCPVDGDREWNANVGARVLYKLCGATIKKQGAQ